ncbi:MAG: TonB-dependent receptor [Jejuia sp.]
MYQLKYISIVLFVLIFNSIVFAQINISGTVSNSKNEPIENVTLFLEPSNRTAYTGTDGSFKLENISEGNYKISASILGYKNALKIIEIKDEDLTINFILEQDLLNLQTVVVTGTFDPRTVLESNTSISILNSEDIQQTYPQGTAGLLQNIPGTFTDPSAGEVYTKVYTRGISASAEDDMGWYYVSLQEDGLPVSLIQHSYYGPDLFHRVDLTTKKVEAIRGGSSTITSLNAPGGIYNFMSYGAKSSFGGEFQATSGAQGDGNMLYRGDMNLGGPLGNNWFFNAGGHYRHDDGARDTDFVFSKGGQFRFDVIKKTNGGQFKFYGKILNDKTNRHTGVAATNWDNPSSAFGQDFSSTSLLMPDFDGSIPDGRNLNNSNTFNPSQGVHAKDLALGLNFSQDLGNRLTLKNHFRFSAKEANWQTSISNAFVSLNDPTAYLLSDLTVFSRPDAILPFGQVIFRDAQSGNELASVDNSGLFGGNPFQYLTDESLPNDAIMGTSAWYKDNETDEWINQFELQKKWDNHDFSTGFVTAYANTSHFTQGSFAFATYEPNPRMLSVTLENPGQPVIALSDENGLSNYGGLFFVNAEAKVTQIAAFINDRWEVSKNLHLDLGLRFENIAHNGSKDRFAPADLNGGIDGDPTTAYDNGIISPTGEKDYFKYNYNYLSYSAGINYKINKNTAIFSRFSKGNKAPELNYYFNNFSNVPINQPGEIQKILQTEFGVKFDTKIVSFTGTAFWSQLKDVGIANFEFDESSAGIFYTPILFNTSNTLGFEWESIYAPIENITLSFNGVLQNPKAEDWKIYDAAGSVDTADDSILDYSGNTLPFNPKLMLNSGIAFDNDKCSGFIKWQYMSKRFGNVANGFELDAYSIFNVGAGYKINEHLSANIVVTNLFNSEGLANFFGENSFGANANGATPEFIANNPDASFVVFPVLQRRGLITLNYTF